MPVKQKMFKELCTLLKTQFDRLGFTIRTKKTPKLTPKIPFLKRKERRKEELIYIQQEISLQKQTVERKTVKVLVDKVENYIGRTLMIRPMWIIPY